MEIKVTIPKLNALKKALREWPEVSAREIDDAIKKSILNIQEKAIKNAPIGVTHGLKPSIKAGTSFGRLKGKIEPTVKYALWVHEGTKPHWPPIAAITPWANRHGIPPFVLARSIARKGTKANPFLTKAIDSVKPNIKKFFIKALDNIAQKTAKKV